MPLGAAADLAQKRKEEIARLSQAPAVPDFGIAVPEEAVPTFEIAAPPTPPAIALREIPPGVNYLTAATQRALYELNTSAWKALLDIDDPQIIEMLSTPRGQGGPSSEELIRALQDMGKLPANIGILSEVSGNMLGDSAFDLTIAKLIDPRNLPDMISSITNLAGLVAPAAGAFFAGPRLNMQGMAEDYKAEHGTEFRSDLAKSIAGGIESLFQSVGLEVPSPDGQSVLTTEQLPKVVESTLIPFIPTSEDPIDQGSEVISEATHFAIGVATFLPQLAIRAQQEGFNAVFEDPAGYLLGTHAVGKMSEGVKGRFQRYKNIVNGVWKSDQVTRHLTPEAMNELSAVEFVTRRNDRGELVTDTISIPRAYQSVEQTVKDSLGYQRLTPEEQGRINVLFDGIQQGDTPVPQRVVIKGIKKLNVGDGMPAGYPFKTGEVQPNGTLRIETPGGNVHFIDPKNTFEIQDLTIPAPDYRSPFFRPRLSQVLDSSPVSLFKYREWIVNELVRTGKATGELIPNEEIARSEQAFRADPNDYAQAVARVSEAKGQPDIRTRAMKVTRDEQSLDNIMRALYETYPEDMSLIDATLKTNPYEAPELINAHEIQGRWNSIFSGIRSHFGLQNWSFSGLNLFSSLRIKDAMHTQGSVRMRSMAMGALDKMGLDLSFIQKVKGGTGNAHIRAAYSGLSRIVQEIAEPTNNFAKVTGLKSRKVEGRKAAGMRLAQDIKISEEVTLRQGSDITPKTADILGNRRVKVDVSPELLSFLSPEQRARLVGEAMKPQIELHLKTLGGKATFETFMEGAAEIADLFRTIAILERGHGLTPLTEELLNTEYFPRIPRGESRYRSQTGRHKISETTLHDREWFSDFARSIPEGSDILERAQRNPLAGIFLRIDANLWRMYKQPAIELARNTVQMLKEGVRLNVVVQSAAEHSRESIPALRPGTRIVFDPIKDSEGKVIESGDLVRRAFRIEVGEEAKPVRYSAADSEAFDIRHIDSLAKSFEIRKVNRFGDRTERNITVEFPEGIPVGEVLQHFRIEFPDRMIETLDRVLGENMVGEPRNPRFTRNAIMKVAKATKTPMSEMEADVLARQLPSLAYADFLGGRPSSAFKNLTQSLQSVAIVGKERFGKALDDLHTPEAQALLKELGMDRAPMDVVTVQGEGSGAMMALALQDFTGAYLKGFTLADRFNRGATLLAAFRMVAEEGVIKDLPLREASDLAKKLHAEGNVRGAAAVYAQGVEASTQWWYSKMNRPGVVGSGDWRAVFTTWPLNYAEKGLATLNQIARNPEARPELTKQSLKYLASSVAVIIAGRAALDADLAPWFGLGPISDIGNPFAASPIQGALHAGQSGFQLLFDPSNPYHRREVTTGLQQMANLPFVRHAVFGASGELAPGSPISDLTTSARLLQSGNPRAAVGAIVFGRGSVARARRDAEAQAEKRSRRPSRKTRRSR